MGVPALVLFRLPVGLILAREYNYRRERQAGRRHDRKSFARQFTAPAHACRPPCMNQPPRLLLRTERARSRPVAPSNPIGNDKSVNLTDQYWINIQQGLTTLAR